MANSSASQSDVIFGTMILLVAVILFSIAVANKVERQFNRIEQRLEQCK